MKTKTWTANVVVAFIILILISCKEKKLISVSAQQHTKFDTGKLLLKDDLSTKKVHGQVLYLPVYSNIPNPEMGEKYDMSAFLAIHNTDFNNVIKITKVLLFALLMHTIFYQDRIQK
jgi:hypothetical protein